MRKPSSVSTYDPLNDFNSNLQAAWDMAISKNTTEAENDPRN